MTVRTHGQDHALNTDADWYRRENADCVGLRQTTRSSLAPQSKLMDANRSFFSCEKFKLDIAGDKLGQPSINSALIGISNSGDEVTTFQKLRYITQFAVQRNARNGYFSLHRVQIGLFPKEHRILLF